MKALVRRFVLPFLAIVVLSFLSVLVFGFAAEPILGSWEMGRFFPFSNAHLLEEAAEGIYSPVQDPLFVVHSLAVVGVAFGFSAFWGGLGATRHQLVMVLAAVVIGVGLYAFHLRSAFSSYSPTAIKIAAAFVLLAALAAGCTGTVVSRYLGARRG